MIGYLRIALPFVLIGLGGLALYASPLPAVLRLTLGRARVRAPPTLEAYGLPAITALCWGAAIGLSLGNEARQVQDEAEIQL